MNIISFYVKYMLKIGFLLISPGHTIKVIFYNRSDNGARDR